MRQVSLTLLANLALLLSSKLAQEERFVQTGGKCCLLEADDAKPPSAVLHLKAFKWESVVAKHCITPLWWRLMMF